MTNLTGSRQDVFALPIADKVLVYAPLHNLAALIDSTATGQLRQSLAGDRDAPSAGLADLVETLRAPGLPLPQPRQGGLGMPLFLGLIPTRGCNMRCAYCDFAAPKQTSPVMDLDTARQAIDAYLELLAAQGGTHMELHFFGGEPFFAPRTLHFVVEYGLAKAAERGFSTHLEIITNGFFNLRTARWAAGVFDTVFLSLDGPREIQDRYRPGPGGRSVFDTVTGNARLFSEQGVELILRSCITAETVERMPEIAAWFAEQFHPAAVCFETLVDSQLSQANGIHPPDPWAFARSFGQAAALLARQGIETVLSTADLGYPHLSFCPVGKDALIVTPDGCVHACYLLEEEWRREGLDLTYARLDERAAGGLVIDQPALDQIRELHVEAYPLCADCFCRFNCSGGCHVNRRAVLSGQEYDATCIQTRLVSASILLNRLGPPGWSPRGRAAPGLHQAVSRRTRDRL